MIWWCRVRIQQELLLKEHQTQPGVRLCHHGEEAAVVTEGINKRIHKMNNMANKIVSIQNLKREFKMGVEVVRALKGVSFDIEPGEFVTIMGSSGSGKTTMLNILGCLDKPSDGKYLLDGVDVGSLSRNDLAVLRNHKIGFVFQSYNLLA